MPEFSMVLTRYTNPEVTYCLILQTFLMKVNAYYEIIGTFSEPTNKKHVVLLANIAKTKIKYLRFIYYHLLLSDAILISEHHISIF